MPNNQAVKPLLFLSVLMSLPITGCDDHHDTATAEQTPKVTYLTVKPQAVSLYTELPGRTLAYRVAEIRPQVSGVILKRHFTEGSDVEAGQSLYQIDPAPFKAAVDRAAAQVDQAVADARMAQVTLDRYRSLMGPQYVSRQEYDQAVATAAQAQATTDSARAALKSAQIDLTRTRVISPLTGRIGLSTVTEGALVQSEQTDALATVQQLDPLYVDITQSADDFLHLQQQLASGQLQQVNGKVPLQVILSDGASYPHQGSVAFSDVTVDKTTGSITLRAIVPNPGHQLLPGMFVRAKLDQGHDVNALLVPQQAIVRTARGDATVVIVDTHNKVAIREVEVTPAANNQLIVKQGITAGDHVVIAGGQRVNPGMLVTPIESSGTAQ
ncbi:efflux RND transporter periplasmic adaptor subunit [Rosenbergiella nectarea]|uniref:efflux RND transporter periplasmic adaptor subunit n=1 Tax=Rosenbergiella nectarea TaxID=988801 RepID=UPI001BDAB6F3|nr:efflux RND transporter periplasmic adaptor subunit [Rosenbergiella nectarea]MBT0728791.1 efflux RND transporter periplasmic adaptor subunit [Rosenbergiella nectarea subsp. apis]